MHGKQKKRLIVLAAVLVVALASVGAYAYFTASGSGSGTASVGSSDAIELTSPLVGDLFPGGADVPVTVTISNADGGGAQHVGTVSGVVQTNGSCLGSWFVVDDVAYADTIAAGGSDTAATVVRMLDSGSNQDACQGLTMNIAWSSN